VKLSAGGFHIRQLMDHDRQGQAAHRQYELCTIAEFASCKAHAYLILMKARDSAHDFSVNLLVSSATLHVCL